jgi:hypothetical protein
MVAAALNVACSAALIPPAQRANAIAGCYEFDRSLFSTGIFYDQTGYPHMAVHRRVRLHDDASPYGRGKGPWWVITLANAALDSATQAAYAKQSYWEVRGRDSIYLRWSNSYMHGRNVRLAVRQDSLIGQTSYSSDLDAILEPRGDKWVVTFRTPERTRVTAARVPCND